MVELSFFRLIRGLPTPPGLGVGHTVSPWKIEFVLGACYCFWPFHFCKQKLYAEQFSSLSNTISQY